MPSETINNSQSAAVDNGQCYLALPFRLPATSELRPSGLTMAAWLNEKGSQPRRFRVIRVIRVRKHDVAVFWVASLKISKMLQK